MGHRAHDSGKVTVAADANNFFNQHYSNSSGILLNRCDKYLCTPEFTFNLLSFKYITKKLNSYPFKVLFKNLTKASYHHKLEICITKNVCLE